MLMNLLQTTNDTSIAVIFFEKWNITVSTNFQDCVYIYAYIYVYKKYLQ